MNMIRGHIVAIGVRQAIASSVEPGVLSVDIQGTITISVNLANVRDANA